MCVLCVCVDCGVDCGPVGGGGGREGLRFLPVLTYTTRICVAKLGVRVRGRYP